ISLFKLVPGHVQVEGTLLTVMNQAAGGHYLAAIIEQQGEVIGFTRLNQRSGGGAIAAADESILFSVMHHSCFRVVGSQSEHPPQPQRYQNNRDDRDDPTAPARHGGGAVVYTHHRRAVGALDRSGGIMAGLRLMRRK